jgi:hypothetical protein
MIMPEGCLRAAPGLVDEILVRVEKADAEDQRVRNLRPGGIFSMTPPRCRPPITVCMRCRGKGFWRACRLRPRRRGSRW